MSTLIYKSRPEWLLERAKTLGGSDAATLTGHGYGSEYAMWAEKVAASPKDEAVPEYVEAGTFMEPAILAWWQHRTGLVATPTPYTIIRNDAYPWAHASPDALVGEDAGLDAKNAAWFRASEYEDGKLPLGHQVQAQHYMAVTGRFAWHFAALVGGNRLLISTVARDDEFITELMHAEREWWTEHVVGRVPPEPDGSEETRVAIHRMFPKELDGEIRPLDETFAALRDQLDAAEADKKTAEGEITSIKNQIKAALGTAIHGVFPDGSRWQWKVEPRDGYTVPPSEPRILRFVKAPKEKKKR